ncbi:E3 ubiquitin-protein ligase PUB23 [Lactuca sativa]|uniref:U-box domain-containing protein n=1 Tax=Lactuca sativa TaxID=4236 RepID=A0A9R1V346_LACSA|nr:E3 ubiquitin-protein ligase PUB23 [Lactuca sativa]KAJ0198721.1 hypothetical protein LSAT_V11C600312050 [Lactuca sativa]
MGDHNKYSQTRNLYFHSFKVQKRHSVINLSSQSYCGLFLKFIHSIMGDHKNVEVPPFFVCPISLELMKDPVTLSTGITYDRESIEKWLYAKKNNTCPVTKQVLSDLDLTPNHTLRRLIQSWCTLNPLSGVERVSTPRIPISKSEILKLLKDLKYPNLQMKSLKRLKVIVLENETNKRSMEAVGAVDYLAHILSDQKNVTSSSPAAEDSDVEGFELVTPADEALGILYHMQLSQTGLQGLFAKTGDFVETLTSVMQRAANYESRTYAVMLLKSMFEATSQNMQVTSSLKPEFFMELVKILNDQISQKATIATLKLLINVCLWGRNKIRAAEAAAVPALIDLLLDSSDKRLSEMVLLALDLLCQCAEGRSELLKHGAGLAVVSKKIFRISQLASDRAVRILHSVAKFSGNTTVVTEMLHLGVAGKLCLVLQVDCGSKMKEKAMEILKMHARVWNNSSCIPSNLLISYPS